MCVTQYRILSLYSKLIKSVEKNLYTFEEGYKLCINIKRI
jgi:hypothetical protein